MLKGKVAVVTGSTSGIGLGIAKELARLGADLMLNGFGDASEIESIRSSMEREHGVRVVYDGADMSKGEAVRGLIAATVQKFGRLSPRRAALQALGSWPRQRPSERSQFLTVFSPSRLATCDQAV
jgi:NAD(P)-dependent dehydrogenase (short-subunit alcohol dehydrogenase family)